MKLFSTAKAWDRADWGHGLCWHNYASMTVTTALIPLNIPLRIGYLIYVWCKVPFLGREPKWIQEKVRR